MRTIGSYLARLPLGGSAEENAGTKTPLAQLAEAARAAHARTAGGAAREGSTAEDPGSGLLHGLAASLPAGHLHLWGGPVGAGKTSFLLELLAAAAQRGRPVLLASYDLPAETLAMRLLAICAAVSYAALPDPRPEGATETHTACALDPAALLRAREARRALSELPFALIEARGLSVRSLEDRLVRMPWRPAVLAVDYVQALARPAEQDLAGAVQALAALAVQHHVAVFGVVRPLPGSTHDPLGEFKALAERGRPDRVGWIETRPEHGAREARLIANRHGACANVPLAYDATTGALSTS